MDELEPRLIELETLVAFHEETITSLSNAMHEQQKAIDNLTRRLAQAESKLREIRVSDAMDPTDEPPPPHY